MARILVLDGHSAAALAVTRSAGHAGHWVAVGANEGAFAAAQLSRYCRLRFSHPNSTDGAARFAAAVLDFVRARSIDLIVPVTDWTIGPLSENRNQLDGICRISLPPPGALEIASDKYQTLRIAQKVGIEVPKTSLIDLAGEESLDGFKFPSVIKDRFSIRWSKDKAVFGSVSYAYSQEDLKNKVVARVLAAGDVMVQEFVAGIGLGFSCFIAGGDFFLPFQWERVREVDPRGSASSARKSIPLDEKVVSMSSRLMREIGFEGIAMVEYKRMPDGRMVLMEINGRPWGSLGLPIACGIDYPRYLIDWALKGTLPPKNIAYRPEILCRRVVGELTHLSNLRAGKPANWAGTYPSFWPSLAKMTIPWMPGMCYDDLWLSDLRPGVASVKQWFRSRMRARS